MDVEPLKLGDVLRQERDRIQLTSAEVAESLGIPKEQFEEMESGTSKAEIWGPLLGRIAVKLGVPTARLLAETGRAADARPGRAGPLIRSHRVRKGRTVEEMASLLDINVAEYKHIEEGRSPIEQVGPLLLRFAELIEQPMFNLFCPAGVPLEALEPRRQ